MFDRWRQVVGVMPIFLGACAHLTTSNTNQFYLAQTYLPVVDPPIAQSKGGDAKCVAGPVIDHHRDDADRVAARVLPGMALRVVETTYSATADNSVPVISDWTWIVPETQPTSSCGNNGATVPSWSRSDMLMVRSLLSGAQQSQKGLSNTEYFQEAVAAACTPPTNVPATDFPGCLNINFLDKFVAGLTLNMRDQADTPNTPSPTPGNLEPAPYPEVLAAAGAPAADATIGFASWYSALAMPRKEDLFAKGGQATSCARAFSDGAPLSPQDIEVCKFALASLEWRGVSTSRKMPGTTLSGISELWLLRSGDPLLLMQPQAYRNPLDVSGTAPCAGSAACKLRDRMAQGFVNVEVLIPVIVGTATRQMVPIGMSVAQYERSHGVTVKAIRRSAEWLPAKILVVKAKSPEPKPGQRVTLRFGKGEDGITISPAITDGADPKNDLLFAPGDVILLSGTR